jgi:hypothetical protein
VILLFFVADTFAEARLSGSFSGYFQVLFRHKWLIFRFSIEFSGSFLPAPLTKLSFQRSVTSFAFSIGAEARTWNVRVSFAVGKFVSVPQSGEGN